MLKTPVVILVFSRPDTTEQVFAEIARAKPSKLFVVADGPRVDRPEEIEKCSLVRSIVERVDWDCDVLTKYSEVNLGCLLCSTSGISWVFEHVDRAIILEDDCLPHPSFFRFCQELLERYRDDERIMTISGNNFLFDQESTHYSYYYGRLSGLWGWATWRRAWKHMDMNLTLWPELRDTPWLTDIVEDPRAVEYWKTNFNRPVATADNWDQRWLFSQWAQNGLGVSPKKNLVSNIGFGSEGTHTKSSKNRVANLPAHEMLFPLQHPPEVVQDKKADKAVFENVLAVKQKKHANLTSIIPRSVRKSIRYIRNRWF